MNEKFSFKMSLFLMRTWVYDECRAFGDKKKRERAEQMRNVKMDNLKGILILLVVTGHFLEICMGKGFSRYLYFLIYFFHMPLFVYCSGYFAKCTDVGERILKRLLLPYVIFQMLYILFERIVLKNKMELQFSKPYWILWYLVAMMVWSVLLPVVATDSRKKQLMIFVLAVAAALAAGYDNGVGRSMSLSRIIVYFPFFLLGYDLHMWDKEREGLPENGQETGRDVRTREMDILAVKYKKIISCLAVAALIGIVVITGVHMKAWKLSWFYEAASYERTGSDVEFRLFHLAVGTLGILGVRRFLPDRKIPVIEKIGQKTMPIYLTHGFLVKWIDMYDLFS